MDAELKATFGNDANQEPKDLSLEEFLRGMTARDVGLRSKKERRGAASPAVAH